MLFENENARVLEIRQKPGARDQMHSHPENVVYFLSDANAMLHLKDGGTKPINAQKGKTSVSASGEVHSLENTGTTDFHAIMVELKKKGIGEKAAVDPVAVAPEIYRTVMENGHVRVVEIRQKPGQQDQMHSHPPNVVYYLADADARLRLEDGSFKVLSAKTGGTSVSTAGETHALENTGSTELHAVMFEIK